MDLIWILGQSAPEAVGNSLIEWGTMVLALPGELGWGAIAGWALDRLYLKYFGKLKTAKK